MFRNAAGISACLWSRSSDFCQPEGQSGNSHILKLAVRHLQWNSCRHLWLAFTAAPNTPGNGNAEFVGTPIFGKGRATLSSNKADGCRFGNWNASRSINLAWPSSFPRRPETRSRMDLPPMRVALRTAGHWTRGCGWVVRLLGLNFRQSRTQPFSLCEAACRRRGNLSAPNRQRI